MEEYRVYRWRAKQHAGSDLLTARIIGGIEMACSALLGYGHIPIIKQPAHVAKNFVSDDKLQAWGFYERGQKHANDAIRHACYWQLFGKELASQTKEAQVG